MNARINHYPYLDDRRIEHADKAAQCRKELERNGVCTLPNFLDDVAVKHSLTNAQRSRGPSG